MGIVEQMAFEGEIHKLLTMKNMTEDLFISKKSVLLKINYSYAHMVCG